MEIIIKKLETGIIEFNYGDIKKFLEQELEKYQGLVYTQETIATAKSDRANLNKLKKAIDDKRKEVKKECLKPYDAFELKIKDLIEFVDKPVNEIDEQIKGYESALKEDKFIKIIEIYDNNIGDLKDILPLAKIQDDKWTNLTVKIKEIETAIKEIVNKVTTDLQVIDNFDTEFKFEIKNKYLDTLDLSKALSEKAILEERKKNLDELKKKEEEQKDEIPTFATIKKAIWHGYLHTSGTIQVKPKICEIECGSPFVQKYIPPFEVETNGDVRDNAIAIATKYLKDNGFLKEKLYSFQIEIKTTIEKKDLFKTFLIDNNIEFKTI